MSREFGKRIGMSRSSLTQIELGNRSVNILELQHLSMELEFSSDDFMSDNFEVNSPVKEKNEVSNSSVEERIAVPNLKIDKFKNILEKCAGKSNVGETVLYKLLYFSDFNYYELYEEHLTDAKYRKLPYGPVPQKLNSIINQMIVGNTLKRVKTEYHGFIEGSLK